MTALAAEPIPTPPTAKRRPRSVDPNGCCAPCRRRAKRRAEPRKQKDPEELSSFIAHVIRLVRRDAAAVAEPVEVLRTLAALSSVVDDEIRQAVADLRERDYTWGQIGAQFGIGKTAAQKRFGGDR